MEVGLMAVAVVVVEVVEAGEAAMGSNEEDQVLFRSNSERAHTRSLGVLS